MTEITRKVCCCFVVSSAEDWITLWKVSRSQMQRLPMGLNTRVTEWKMMAHTAQEPRLEIYYLSLP